MFTDILYKTRLNQMKISKSVDTNIKNTMK